MPKKTFSATASTASSPNNDGVKLNDFCAYMPQPNSFFFMPCRELWPGSNIDRRLPRVPVLTKAGQPKRDKNGKVITIPATKWITDNCSVEQATWAPGQPMLIPNRLYTKGGIIERNGVQSFNLYRAPQIKLGDASKVGPWLDHMYLIFRKEDAEHSIKWFAQRVQQPQEKINHALVWAGAQGIGKDSLLEPVKEAVGSWNCHDISPPHLLGAFNDFTKSVILRINEARDLGEFDRFKFYEHSKNYMAAPPPTLRVNEKHLREYYVPNCVGVIITTNHKTDGIYLRADDRRHFVVWSDYKKEEFTPEYWNELWSYYRDGGFEHVAAYLTELDISDFDPKAPPPQTPAFWEIVHAHRPLENNELADVLDTLGKPDPTDPQRIIWPDAVTIPILIAAATGTVAEWMSSPKGRQAIRYRLDDLEYIALKNPATKDGMWKVSGARQAVYVKAVLSPAERLDAARKL